MLGYASRRVTAAARATPPRCLRFCLCAPPHLLRSFDTNSILRPWDSSAGPPEASRKRSNVWKSPSQTSTVVAGRTPRRKLKSDALAMRADVDLQWEKVNRAISRFAKRDAVAEEKVNGADDLNERIRRGDPIG